MAVKVFNKPYLQTVLRGLRKAGYTVTLTNGRYEVYIDGAIDEAPVLTALNGRKYYLVRYDDELLTESEA